MNHENCAVKHCYTLVTMRRYEILNVKNLSSLTREISLCYVTFIITGEVFCNSFYRLSIFEDGHVDMFSSGTN